MSKHWPNSLFGDDPNFLSFFFLMLFVGILTEMSNVSEISLPRDSITRVSCFQRSRT